MLELSLMTGGVAVGIACVTISVYAVVLYNVVATYGVYNGALELID